MGKARQIVIGIAVLAGLVLLPLLGVILAGLPLARYLEFPPQTLYVEHAPFSWIVFGLTAIAIAAVVAPFLLRVVRSASKLDSSPAQGRFPWWGWCGLTLTALAWFAAWSRMEWMAPFQKFTFSPIWFGYILVVNGLSQRRKGDCLLTGRPLAMLTLFIVSALFWWYFEYLNRFVQNWIYRNVGDLEPFQYFLFATLPFATVLPAVMSTNELLRTIPRLTAGLDDFLPFNLIGGRSWAGGLLILCGAGLAGVAVFPNQLFPLLWLAPLFAIVAAQALCGRKTIFAPLANGDWSNVCRLAFAALICGFFWELWNYGSLARWEYIIPYVGRFHLFEMPILGYAGYIPFGIECGIIADFVLAEK